MNDRCDNLETKVYIIYLSIYVSIYINIYIDIFYIHICTVYMDIEYMDIDIYKYEYRYL